MADLVFCGLLLAVMLVVIGFQGRYYLRRVLSRNWPTATATIKQAYVGVIDRGAGAGFFGYVFTVNGAEYSGQFILPDNWDHAEKLQHELDGRRVLIKFSPRNPTVSLLADFYDPTFGGLVATQNPYWYLNSRERDSMLTLDLNKK
jgi:hypothetical protein